MPENDVAPSVTTDFLEHNALEAQRRIISKRLEQKAHAFYKAYAPEKDKVSTARFPWSKRTIVGFRVGEDHIEVKVEHFVTRFAGNGMCYLEYPQHKLKIPAAMIDLTGDDLMRAIADLLSDEKIRMDKKTNAKKAA
jgi:hypothetical protein